MLGQIILIQSIPKFELIKKHPLTAIKLYYGFYIYLLSCNDKDIHFTIKYLFLTNKFIIFTSYFCRCLENYIKTHPQKEFACKRSIKYMSTRSVRINVYRNAKHNLSLVISTSIPMKKLIKTEEFLGGIKDE